MPPVAWKMSKGCCHTKFELMSLPDLPVSLTGRFVLRSVHFLKLISLC